jgi:hypothetical protein
MERVYRDFSLGELFDPDDEREWGFSTAPSPSGPSLRLADEPP